MSNGVALKLGLFTAREEIFSFTLTCIALCFVFLELVLFGVLLERFSYGALIISFLSLQSLHVVLTFLGLIYLPEFKSWVQRSSKGKTKIFWLKISLLTLTLFALFFYASSPFYRSPNAPLYIVSLVVIMNFMITLHHRLSQTYGISLAYSHRQNQSGLPRPLRNYKIEKYAFVSLLMFTLLLYAFRLPNFAVVFQEYGFTLSNSVRKMIAYPSYIIAICLAFFLVFFSLYEGISQKIKIYQNYKAAHSLKTIFYPFSLSSFIALLAMECLHGIEYVLIWRKLSRGSSGRFLSNRAITLTISTIVVIFTLIVFIPELWLRLELPREGFQFLLLRIFVAANVAITYAHFYLDRKLFRMRNPASREIVGKILNS